MHTQKIRVLFLIVCLSCLFLCSCGLDEYYVIDQPTCSSPAKIDQDDITQMVYTFTIPAVNVLSSSQVNMNGTAVYYKIVEANDENKENLSTEIETINSVNSEFSENGINKIKNTYIKVSFKSGNSSTEYIRNSDTEDQVWTMTLKENLISGNDTSGLALLTAKCGSSTLDVVIPDQAPGEYYINAYAVNVGEVALSPHYSALAHLGVLKFTIE